MTKEEKNRRIAEWLERSYPESGTFQHCDFFADETASALLLDRIIESDRRYGCPYASHPLMTRIVSMKEDRKTAICEAALRLIDTPHASGQTR